MKEATGVWCSNYDDDVCMILYHLMKQLKNICLHYWQRSICETCKDISFMWTCELWSHIPIVSQSMADSLSDHHFYPRSLCLWTNTNTNKSHHVSRNEYLRHMIIRLSILLTTPTSDFSWFQAIPCCVMSLFFSTFSCASLWHEAIN